MALYLSRTDGHFSNTTNCENSKDKGSILAALFYCFQNLFHTEMIVGQVQEKGLNIILSNNGLDSYAGIISAKISKLWRLGITVASSISLLMKNDVLGRYKCMWLRSTVGRKSRMN